MNLINRIFLYIFIFTLSSVVCRCSIDGEFYLVNLTTDSVDVTLNLDYKIENLDTSPYFHYSKIIEEVKFNIYEGFNDTLWAEITDNKTIKVIVPPQSTTFLGTGTNYSSYFNSICMVSDKKEMEWEHPDFDNITLKKQGISHFVAYFEFD